MKAGLVIKECGELFVGIMSRLTQCKDCENQVCNRYEGMIFCGITGEPRSPYWYCDKRRLKMAYWKELTEEQKQEKYKKYVEEVKTKHTESSTMTYAEYCKEWEDCNTIEVS